MAHYSTLPQFEDIEIQRSPDQGGGAIKSITISKETKPDGSIVRRKETLLSNGKTMVEEHGVSGGSIHAGIRFLPALSIFSTNATGDRLPLHHRPFFKDSYDADSKDEGYGVLFKFSICLLVVLISIQILLWYMIRSGQDYDTLVEAFQDSFFRRDQQ